jgi:acyl-CoA reductase-like NAD-dependent aldehyde dehydrogenase
VYYFGANGAGIATVLERTTSGGACVNDAKLQFPQDALPFGSVGPSGMRADHGRAGFEKTQRLRIARSALRTALHGDPAAAAELTAVGA